MARRQEQETARGEVTEVDRNILRMELPIQLPGLGHVNCYAIVDSEGAAIVDPGLPGPSSWRALQDRLKQAGLATRNIHSVIITHSHPDHFGGAARFAKEAGAQVIAHRQFSFGPMAAAEQKPEVSVEDVTAQSEAREQDVENDEDGDTRDLPSTPHSHSHSGGSTMQWSGKTPWGGVRPRPPLKTRLRWRVLKAFGRTSIVPNISHPVDHGDVVHLGGREWFVVHTPGHTPDHFCLHDPVDGVFLAGDHVLPTIPPHISGLGGSEDNLSSFFYSLDRVSELSHVQKVLPAHGHPFSDLRERSLAIKRHHFDRLDKIKEIAREIGPGTVEAFSRQLFKERSWGPMAESETFAHLEHLRIAGEAERHSDEEGCYVYVI